jgi:hypothetical protein
MSREEYVRKLLEAYRTTPGTTGHIRRPDRVLAAHCGNAVYRCRWWKTLVLAASRRLMHSPEAPPAGHDSLAGLLCLFGD